MSQSVLNVARMLLRDVLDAKINGIVLVSVNLDSGRDTSHFAISFSQINRRMKRKHKKLRKYRRKSILNPRRH